MKIVHAILTSGLAGSERYVADVCNRQALRHDVVLVIWADGRNEQGFSIRDWVEPRVRIVEMRRLFRRWRFSRIIRCERPDVVHAHLGRAARLAGSLRGPWKTVATVHTRYSDKEHRPFDALIFPTAQHMRNLPADYPGKAEAIANPFVPNRKLTSAELAGLRAELGLPEGAFVIGGLGRLNTDKGFDLLIRAFGDAAIEGAVLLIVGGGEEEAELRRIAGPNVRFTGFRADAKDLFQVFDLYVSPARREMFGLVFLEAMDAGTPILATETQGALAVLAGTPAQLVPPAETDGTALTRALRTLAAQRPARRTYDLSRFDMETHLDKLDSVYRAPQVRQIKP
ncbi:MAG TPA: glycosyltransferase [Arenibaculum sp.]|nr:glycosyltransferase [Arenibaculum sp.]